MAQIGYQTAAPVQSWVEIEGALDNALDTLTPAGQGGAVSFVEIYLSAFEGLSAADATALEAYDERLRVRAALQRAGADPTSKPKDPEDVLPLVYVVPAGALTGQHYYKVGGLEMSASKSTGKSTGGCDVGGVLAVP